jgi:hypothetical protein
LTQDPFRILGLGHDASETEVRARFRELALREHPDVGGDPAVMARLIAAYRSALVLASAPRAPGGVMPLRRARSERDASSFTVDVLPVEAFEYVRLAAAALGEISDEEVPYALEFLVRAGETVWCRCELFPDAGSTTVAVTVAPAGPEPLVRVDGMRDLLVAEINSLGA